MKKYFAILPLILFLVKPAFGGILSPFADTFLTVELGKAVLSRDSVKSDFSNTSGAIEAIRQFEDIAVGGNIRFLKKFWVNVNWSKTSLKNDRVSGVNNLSSSAKYKADQINYTGLYYITLIPTRAEIFLEAGIASIGNKLNYSLTDGTKYQKNDREVLGLGGVGIQISPLGGDYIRLSLHKYVGKIGLLDSNYTQIRLGYLKSF